MNGAVIVLVASLVASQSSQPRPSPTPQITKPTWVSTPMPDSSPLREQCSKHKLSGVVAFEAHMLADATLGEVRIVRSSGCPDADKLIIDTVKQWTFRPALQDGKPISTWLTMSINHFWGS